jgi:hypothetical protein
MLLLFLFFCATAKPHRCPLRASKEAAKVGENFGNKNSFRALLR